MMCSCMLGSHASLQHIIFHHFVRKLLESGGFRLKLRTKVREGSGGRGLADRRLTSLSPCLYLQGEGELQVSLRQPC